MYKSCNFMRFSTIFTVQSLKSLLELVHSFFLFLSFDFVSRSSLLALFLKSLLCSRNQGSLKSKERLSDFKERCAQLCYFLVYQSVCPLPKRIFQGPTYLVRQSSSLVLVLLIQFHSHSRFLSSIFFVASFYAQDNLEIKKVSYVYVYLVADLHSTSSRELPQALANNTPQYS